MDENAPLPRWFRAAFVAVMLALVAELIWFVPQQVELRFQIDDAALSLDTSRQREAKQQYEYDQVATQLPLTLAELEATQPLADAAEAREQTLRTQRKTLRSQKTSLQTQLDAAVASSTDLQASVSALQAEVDALRAQEAALQSQVDELLRQLGRTE